MVHLIIDAVEMMDLRRFEGVLRDLRPWPGAVLAGDDAGAVACWSGRSRPVALIWNASAWHAG